MGIADLMITSDGIKYPTVRFDKRLSKEKRYWKNGWRDVVIRPKQQLLGITK